MPEGDTVHRTAATLAQAIVSRPLDRLRAPRLRVEMPPEGTSVTDVRAIGKHLLLEFDDGHVLHTHLGMTGSWHVQPTGRPWQRGRHRMRVRLADPAVEAVCFDAPVVELLDAAALARHPVVRRLGPDLCAPTPDLGEALARMRTVPPAGAVLVDVLLDQRVAAGVGNVFASELAFLVGRHPATPWARIDSPTRTRLLEEAHRVLRANIVSAHRTTVPGAAPGSLWVYGRDRRPCRRCGTGVRVARTGAAARPTYWCPNCQPADAPPRVPSPRTTPSATRPGPT